jgi:hypothetical protein
MLGNSRLLLVINAPGFVRSRLAVAFTATTVLAASYAYAPFVERGLVLCPMHGLIGLPCPSCGLTRAFCRLARLDILTALSYHALSVPLFAACLAAPVVCGYEILRGRASRLHSLLYSRQSAWAIAAVMMLHHVIRVLVWLSDGTLVTGYLKTSWTYALLRAMGIVAA